MQELLTLDRKEKEKRVKKIERILASLKDKNAKLTAELERMSENYYASK